MSNQFVKYADIHSLPDAEDVQDTGSKRSDIFDRPVTILTDEENNEPDRLTKLGASMNTKINDKAAFLHNMAHDEDPKEKIIKEVGDLNELRLSGAQVLVATYIRPEKMKSGLILTSSMREEDKFQGKCGLVLKMGPLAYKETEKMDFGGYAAKVGDWVWYRPVDGYSLSVRGVHCRVLDDVEIRGDVDHPDVIL